MIGGVGSQAINRDLIGRERELDLVARALDDAAGGRARTMLLGGEAGIGKSSLLAAVLARAEAGGASILLGGCIGLAEGSLPFAPIVEALRPLVRDLETGGVDETADEGIRHALTAVASELGLLTDRRHATSAGAEMRPEWARSRMYEAFLDLLRGLAVDRPVILAIEDLHWADDSTRELLAFLVRNAQSERLLLLITFRSDELTRRHPLLFWLAETDRSPGVERVEIQRLDRDSVGRQLAGILGHPPSVAFVDSVFERSEGNPFFAEELVAAGAESRRLPPTLREVLAARLARISEATTRLLGVAAVVGREVDHDLLAQLAGLSEPELFDGLQEAVAAQLLIADEHAVVERYAFRHALIAEAAAEAVLPSQRRRLHVTIAEALEREPTMRGAEEAGHLAEIAHHWFEARELSRALVASVRAGQAAFDSSAFVESLRQYERALELWDVVPDAAAAAGIDRIELLRRAAQSCQLAGEFTRAAALLREGIAILEADGEPVRVGLFSERLGRALWTAGEFEAALHAYQRAVELVPGDPPSADRARVLAGYAQVLMLGARYRESQVVAQEALELARTTGERQIEGHAAATLGVDLAYVADADAGVELIREALRIGEDVADYDDIGRGYACLSSALEIAGRVEEGLAVALEGAARMRELGLGATYGSFVQMNADDGLTELGRWDEAVRLAQAAEPLARGNGRTFANLQLARVFAQRGDLDAASHALDRASETINAGAEAQFNGPHAVRRMEVAVWRGDLAAGRAAADEGSGILEQTEDHGALAALYATALRVEAEAAELARAARDDGGLDTARRRSADYEARLHALDDTALPAGYRALVHLWVSFGTAEASRVAGRSDPDAWRRAAEAAEARPSVYEGAYARFRQAEAIVAARGPRDEAATTLIAARTVAEALGARPLLAAIDGLAARARVPLSVAAGPPPQAVAVGAGFDLTPREVEVLRLVAAGRTNRQIGEELFISESTAGVHVSRILGKLGVSGRVEAATMAARLGLAG